MTCEQLSVIEEIRRQQVQRLIEIPSFEKAWPRISSVLHRYVGDFSRAEILDLGDHLSEAFTDKSLERSQGGVSSAGKVWECLIAWYLNLCLYGTNAVCFMHSEYIPSCVLESLSVGLANSNKLSEPDLVVISLPADVSSLVSNNSQTEIIQQYSNLCLSNFNSLCVINVQCKTNWNDNAQIPMLWNMLYSQAAKASLVMDKVSIGTTKHSLEQLDDFGYAFVTVPTNDKSKFKPDSMSVLRVSTLSAGNYWGHPSKNGVASSIQDFFIRNSSRKNFPDNRSVARKTSEEHGYLFFANPRR